MQIKKLLNTPEGYKITKTDIINEEIHIWLVPYKRKKAVCSGCGQVHKDGFHSTSEVVARDQPITGRKVFLHIEKRRYRCPVDGQIHVEHLDWLKKKEELPIDLLKRFIA
jgi:transposase